MRYRLIVLVSLISFLMAAVAFAGEGHEECALCHSAHAGQKAIIFSEDLPPIINTVTGQALGKIDNICMTCHAEEPIGLGYRPVNLLETHPTDIMPEKIELPPEATDLKLEKEGYLTCMGCHDPHPSNTNYMYLRVPTDRGTNLNKFCIWCHPEKDL